MDEGVSGRKSRRDGLDRMRVLLKKKLLHTLIVYKVSRLFRVAYRGFQFFAEDLAEEGLRGISITQGIDTADEKTWKPLAQMHGMIDEMTLTSIADFVRGSLRSLFDQHYVTGALTVGYKAVIVPGAPRTKLGKPRTTPAIDQDIAKLVEQHYTWISQGMPIREGWKRWVDAGGPCDRRSSTGRISYTAYRRMLCNSRYIGVWAFGRKRNQWSAKRDYTHQVVQPDTEVTVRRIEELRVISDVLFFAVQKILASNLLGPRGPKKTNTPRQLWDLVTE